MSLEQLRESNKRRVVEQALVCFTKNGIENTTIAEVAACAGVNERSVYRYFDSKAELVMRTVYLLWERHSSRIEQEIAQRDIGALRGIDQVRQIMGLYADTYRQDRMMLIFAQEAEMFLYKNGRNREVVNRPPVRYSEFCAPLSRAIRTGLEDGSVRRDIDVEITYYNAYAALLGMMQKMALDAGEGRSDLKRDNERLESFCDMVTVYLRSKEA